MNRTKPISTLLGLFSITLPIVIYQFYVKWLGFPDGYKTQLERAEKIFFDIYAWPSVAFGVFFIYLGWISSKVNRGKWFNRGVTAYTLFMIAAIMIEALLRLYY